MPKKSQRVKKSKDGKVTQTVNVYVGKRGGGGAKPSAPRPPAMNPMGQMLTMLSAMRQPVVQPSQFSQLLDPIHRRLDVLTLMQQPRTVEPVNAPAVPLPERPRAVVLDLPDSPLVSPARPAVPAGPPRLDDPHEEVPIEELDAKEEMPMASSSSSSSAAAASSSTADAPGDRPNWEWDRYYNDVSISRMNHEKMDRAHSMPTLVQMAQHLGISTTMGRAGGKKTKGQLQSEITSKLRESGQWRGR